TPTICLTHDKDTAVATRQKTIAKKKAAKKGVKSAGKKRARKTAKAAATKRAKAKSNVKKAKRAAKTVSKAKKVNEAKTSAAKRTAKKGAKKAARSGKAAAPAKAKPAKSVARKRAVAKPAREVAAEPLRVAAAAHSFRGNRFYITTAIAYPNGTPHIGHAYEAIATDALARFQRLDGKDVFFLTGTDEHGLKMIQTAQNEGMTPSDLAARNAGRFKEMDQRLNVSFNRFIRTSEPAHHRSVQEIWRRMTEAGTSISTAIPAGIRCVT